MNYDHLIRDLQRINFYSTNKNKLQIKQHDINENQKETPSHSILKS